MMTLYRLRDGSDAEQVRSALTESCLAHHVVEPEAASAAFPKESAGIVLDDDGRLFRGAAEILPHLEELVVLRDLWHKYGSDACYCDERGNIE